MEEDFKIRSELLRRAKEKEKIKPFDEHWTEEDKLWDISMKESFRQRDERLKRKNGRRDKKEKTR